MPELPEVETIIREMREVGLVGAHIEHASVFWGRTIAGLTAEAFCKRIQNQTILGIDRRAKHLVFTLSNDILMVHLRMTGKFFVDSGDSALHPHERVRLHLKNGRVLRFEDQRKFGKWHLSADTRILDKLGLEPLSPIFTLAAFKQLLKGRNRQIKPFLLDQQFVAGLGNIYVDEALWLAKVHPATTIGSIKPRQIVDLHQAIINVLQAGVDNSGTSLGDNQGNYMTVSKRRGTNQHNLKVFQRKGLPCFRCKSLIEKIVVAQRGTHFCPSCQD